MTRVAAGPLGGIEAGVGAFDQRIGVVVWPQQRKPDGYRHPAENLGTGLLLQFFAMTVRRSWSATDSAWRSAVLGRTTRKLLAAIARGDVLDDFAMRRVVSGRVDVPDLIVGSHCAAAT
jgi:hypothetical protein